jgi:hypothetical protein
MNPSEDTQTQLLIFMATKIMRMEAWMQHMQVRLLANRAGASPETLATMEELFSTKTASDQFDSEMDGFSAQFGDCDVFAREYVSLSNQNFIEAINKAALRLVEKPTP